MGETLVAVCDQCKRFMSDNDGLGFFINFLRRHRKCNFTGCRVVRENNPCPNRVRDYEPEEPGVVFEQGYQEVVRD